MLKFTGFCPDRGEQPEEQTEEPPEGPEEPEEQSEEPAEGPEEQTESVLCMNVDLSPTSHPHRA